MYHSLTILCLLLICTGGIQAQERIRYKQIDSTELFLEWYYPKETDGDGGVPAMIFFFGGGWNGGDLAQFKPHAEYLSKRGIACALAEYRVRKRNNTTPFESVKDAKSAIRFLRENADDLKIDPQKIIASGGSAGGHLAAATALVGAFNEASDKLSISCVPNALVLYNPVIDNGPGGYGYERVGESYPQFSPLHNIRAGAPPTIVFLGTQDRLIPVATMQYYQTVMEAVGSRCDLHLSEGKGHGFFNYKHFDMYEKTLRATDAFLQSLGYLEGEPAVKIE